MTSGLARRTGRLTDGSFLVLQKLVVEEDGKLRRSFGHVPRFEQAQPYTPYIRPRVANLNLPHILICFCSYQMLLHQDT